ncbi:epoxide hydrolase N-terminal domain-containing protein [Rhizorhabdus histidinilytica]
MAKTAATRSVGAPTPFRVDIPDARLAEIRERVARYRHFPAPIDEGDAWRYGINSRWLKRLCDHWLDGFDWRAAEAELNRYPQYRVEIDGITLHYVEIRGEGARRRPLLLLHGWPGSHFEFWKIAERLAFPRATAERPRTPSTSSSPRCPATASRVRYRVRSACARRRGCSTR